MVLWNVIFWAVLTIALVIAELSTIQFISIWFAAGGLCAFVASLFGVNFTWQVVIFVAVSAILLIATRPLVKKFLSRKVEKTNVDAVILKECVVIEEINNVKGTGRVHVDGLDWAAKSVQMEKIFEVNDICVIKEIQGVTVVVEEKQ